MTKQHYCLAAVSSRIISNNKAPILLPSCRCFPFRYQSTQ